MKHAIIKICLVLLVQAVCSRGAELLVPSQYPTIQAAVNAAVDGDTVIIAPGTYSGIGNHVITVKKQITIRSQDGPETCIIDCNGEPGIQGYRGFMMSAGILNGLTITQGYSEKDGGAVYCQSGNVKINNCILMGNTGFEGGAINCINSNLEIYNCFLKDNSTTANGAYGGAIFIRSSSILLINSIISGNSAKTGGGIFCGSGNLTLKNCKINNNSASNPDPYRGGGAIQCQQGALTVIGSEITGNTAFTGAGIYCQDVSSFLISDCNIHGNTSNVSGGGIFFKSFSTSQYGATFAILNSSITDNVVNGTGNCKGGGLYIETPPYTSSQNVNFILSGCIIARNSAGLLPRQVTGLGGGLYCSGQVKLFETDIKENSAYEGGGIYNAGPSIELSRCRISGNSASQGSAIQCIAVGETVLESSVVSGNRALHNGETCPTILCPYPTLRIANCTIVGNTPPAISVPSGTSTISSSSITNSIIYWNNQNRKTYPQLPPNGLSVSYCDIQGGYCAPMPNAPCYAGIGNIDADPCFVQRGYWDMNGVPAPYYASWVEGDYRLTAVSPCIDSGGVAFLMDNKDLAGNPRILGAGIDMGAYEYWNTVPAANAGQDFNAFAWINGIAQVTLDGSASHDPDGDNLTYLWRWTINGNNYEANGVSPVIELPAGEHAIELIVNDGFEDSQPDDVNITVVGPVEGRLWVLPCVLNRQGQQPNILAMLRLPAGITKEQIDTGYKLLLYPGAIEAKVQHITQCWDNGTGRAGITATFDRPSLLAAVDTNGNVTLDVVGRLNTGQYFFGEDSVRIIDMPLKPGPTK